MKKEVLAIFLVVFVGLLGYSIILPILPLYAESFGASPLTAGLLFTSYAVCSFIAGPILGSLSDKHGRKPWLIFSQIGTVIGFLMMGFASSLPWLFAARILDGLSGGNIVIAQAYVSDITEPSERAKTFGLIGVAFGLGFIVGPAIGGILAHWGGYALPAFAAAGISALSILVTAILLPEPKREHHVTESDPKHIIQHFRKFAKDPNLRLMLLLFFVYTFVFYMFTTTMTLYLARTVHANAQQLGFLYGFVGLMVLIGQGGIIRVLLKYFSERRVARYGFISWFISFIVLLFLPKTWPFIILATTFFSLGISQIRPTLTSMITKTASRTEQGKTLGVTQSVDSISAILGPTIGGIVLTYAPLPTFAILEATGVLAGLLLVGQITGHTKEIGRI